LLLDSSYLTLSKAPIPDFGEMGTAEAKFNQNILNYKALDTSQQHLVEEAPFFPGKAPEDLEIRDSMVLEKANPGNLKTVGEIDRAFWYVDPEISHPVAGALTRLKLEGKPDQWLYFMARQAHFIEVEVDTFGHIASFAIETH
jgi:hypothetical protein